MRVEEPHRHVLHPVAYGDALVVEHEVGVIRDAFGYPVDSLKERKPAVVRADPGEVGRYLLGAVHISNLLCKWGLGFTDI